ncbi:MAG: nucleotidyltransferase family protein [Halobacteriales archaeon]
MPTKVTDIITQLCRHLQNFEEEFAMNYISKNTLLLLLSEYGFETTSSEKERNSLLTIVDELKAVSLALQENKIPFVIIKFSELPKSVSDIDILVHNTNNLRPVLHGLGYSLEDDVEPHRSTYVKSIKGTRVSLDLHHHLSWRRVHYLDSQSIIDQSQLKSIDDIKVPFPSLPHDFLITAAHCIFKHNGISLFDILHILSLKESNPSQLNNLPAMYAIAEEYQWKREFDYFLHFISSIESDLRTSFDSESSLFKNLPHQFSLPTVIYIRFSKILRSLSHKNYASTLIQTYAYSLDIFQFLVEQKLGISLIHFFRFLARIKKMIDTVNSIFSTPK